MESRKRSGRNNLQRNSGKQGLSKGRYDKSERKDKLFEAREERGTRSYGKSKPGKSYKSNRDKNERTFENKEERTPRSFDGPKTESKNRPFEIGKEKENRSYGKSRPGKQYKSSGGKRTFENREERTQHSFDGIKTERPYKSKRSNTFGKPYSKDNSYSRSKDDFFENEKTTRSRFEKKKSFEKSENASNESNRDFKPRVIKRKKKTDDGRIRLNKLIANSGICSRREADDMITAGLISVNGKIITELGTKVLPEDEIKYNGERLRQERLVYILLNKPKDYITTMRDPFAKKTVMELIQGACKERVYPVGRLDRETTGVLLLTNDGDLAKKLTHPSYNRKKIYHVYLDHNLKQSDMDAIYAGIELEDGFIKADEISYADPTDKKQIGIEIHSGRNRIVRRLFEHFNYKVQKLDRVYFSGLTKKGLQRGQWRFLTSQEIGMLKMGSFE